MLCGCTIASCMLWKDLGVEAMPADQQANSSVKKINSLHSLSLYSVLQIFRLRLLQRKSLSDQILRGLHCVKQSITDILC